MTMLLGDPRLDDEPRRRLGERGPWWLEAAMDFIGRFGLPVAVSICLGGVMVWIFVGYVKVMAADVAATRVALQQHNEQMVKDAADAHEQQSVMIRITQAMCYNAAKSDAARNACAGSK